MKATTLGLPALLLALPAAAQLATPLPPTGGVPAPAKPEATPPPPPVVAEAPASGQAKEQELSEAERRIRIGIIMLGQLHDLLARIKDEESAEAAVAPIMRASAEFQAWAQGLASLPPLDEETKSLYEHRYLPVIDELNTRLRIQGERIASAEFYGSQNLPAALVRLISAMQ